MGISLNFVTVDDAEDKGTWETVGDASAINDSNYPPKQGNQCIDFEIDPNSEGGVRNKDAISPFDITQYEVGVWFLNPVADANGDLVLANQEDGLYLRLYSGSNYADYFQPQHRKADGNWKGGWLYLRASGAPGEEDRNSGTWDWNEVQNVDRVAVMVNSGDGDTTDKDSGNFGVDWVKYYDKIIVTDDNNGEPYRLADIVAIDNDKTEGQGTWGVVERNVDFYTFFCGLELGDGNNGKFKIENEYLYFDSSSQAQKQHMVVKDKFELMIGVKDEGTKTYSKAGANITGTNNSDLIIESGATVGLYDSKVQGFERIDLGDANIEIVKSDLYNNGTVLIDGSNINIKDSRMYYSLDKSGTIGKVNNMNDIENIEVFNSVDGLEFDMDCTVSGYIAENNDYDIVVKNGRMVELVSSKIDGNKIKRVE